MIILSSDNLGLANVMELSELDVAATTAGLRSQTKKALLMDGKPMAFLFINTTAHAVLQQETGKTAGQKPGRNRAATSGVYRKGFQTLGVNTMEPFWFAIS